MYGGDKSMHIDAKGKEDLNVKSLGNSCTGETTLI